MHCRDIEPLLHAERDGLLTGGQQAELAAHVATCANCRQMRQQLNDTLAAYRADIALINVPAADDIWRDLQKQLSPATVRPAKKRPLAPILWLGTTLAAAAAIAIGYFQTRATVPASVTPETSSPALVAQADYLEAGDRDATTMVFTDQQSGWLVVWAADSQHTSSS